MGERTVKFVVVEYSNGFIHVAEVPEGACDVEIGFLSKRSPCAARVTRDQHMRPVDRPCQNRPKPGSAYCPLHTPPEPASGVPG